MVRILSKHKRKTKKKKTVSRDQNILVLLVEGETEENYVRYLNSVFKKRYKMIIRRKSSLSYPIIREIKNISREESVDVDEIILVYDLEHSKEEHQKFINNNELIHSKTYLVQPCIEVHFLMHHKGAEIPHNRYMNAVDVEKELLKHLKNYKKGKFSWEDQNIGEEQLLLAHNTSLKNFNGFESHSFSMIGQLVKDHFI